MGLGCDPTERFRMRYRNDPRFREREIARVAKRKHERGRFDEYVRHVLSERTGDVQMRRRVGYGRAELIEHLASRFTPGMTMTALLNGSIHIDHNEPVSWFDLADPDQFRRLWRLENLQPMWKSDNCSKGARTVAQWRKAA